MVYGGRCRQRSANPWAHPRQIHAGAKLVFGAHRREIAPNRPPKRADRTRSQQPTLYGGTGPATICTLST